MSKTGIGERLARADATARVAAWKNELAWLDAQCGLLMIAKDRAELRMAGLRRDIAAAQGTVTP